MEHDNVPFEPVYGPPAPRGGVRSWRLRRLPRAALAGGVAAGLALGGAGIAFAATSSTSTPSTTAPSKAAPKPGSGPRFFGGRHGGTAGFGPRGALGGAGPVVHGEYTTRTRSGSYQTVDVQAGQVRAVSSTSITVASTDGYTHTYIISPNTVVDAQRNGISSVAVKDQVQLQATQSANTATATSILDTTKVKSSRAGFGFGPGPGGPPSGRSGSNGGGTSPSTSANTSAS